MRNSSIYLKDALDAMSAIEKFVEGIEFDEEGRVSGIS